MTDLERAVWAAAYALGVQEAQRADTDIAYIIVAKAALADADFAVHCLRRIPADHPMLPDNAGVKL